MASTPVDDRLRQKLVFMGSTPPPELAIASPGPVSPSPEQTTAQPRPKVRLDYLDGARALAALYVVLEHFDRYVGTVYPSVPSYLAGISRSLHWSHFSVVVFIVLSGYCLMIPVARTGNGQLKNGSFDFMKRRARRIIPPYYAAIFWALAMNALAQSVKQQGGIALNAANRISYDASAGSLISHFLLIHSWFKPYVGSISGPLWSMAVEWQIYFLMPFLFLPLFRKGGLAPVLIAGGVVGLVPLLFPFPSQSILQWHVPWFVLLFALGLCAAALNFDHRPQFAKIAAAVRWDWIGAFALVALFALVITFGYVRIAALADSLAGIATACFFVGMTRARAGERSLSAAAKSVCSWRPFVKIGAFSYSLYLIHTPVIGKPLWALAHLHFTYIATWLIGLFVVVPGMVLLAYVFYWFFERPFVGERGRRASA